MEKLLYTVNEVSEVLNIGRNKIYQLMNEGKLESFKVGGSRRFHAETIRKFPDSYQSF